MEVLVLGGLAFVVAVVAVVAVVHAARARSALSLWLLVGTTVAGVGMGVAATLVVRAGNAERTTAERGDGTSSSPDETRRSSSARSGRAELRGSPAGSAGSAGVTPRIETTTALFFGRPHETILIPGRYHGIQGPRELRVEIRRDGRWTRFPLPLVTRPSGRFDARVYLGRIGYYHLRIVDPKERRTSRRLVLELF